MSLGNFFPADYARTQIERQLQPGVVVKFVAKMDDGQLHEKRFVILDVTGSTFTCVINSEISQFIAHRPLMAACQVPIDLANHSFMNWDSHVDCSRIREYSRSEVLDQLCKNPEWVLGGLTGDVLSNIASAISNSKLIPKALAAQCCAAIHK